MYPGLYAAKGRTRRIKYIVGVVLHCWLCIKILLDILKHYCILYWGKVNDFEITLPNNYQIIVLGSPDENFLNSVNTS